MGELIQVSVAIDSDLLARFDQLMAGQGYTHRSEAFRDIIRDLIAARGVQHGRPVMSSAEA